MKPTKLLILLGITPLAITLSMFYLSLLLPLKSCFVLPIVFIELLILVYFFRDSKKSKILKNQKFLESKNTKGIFQVFGIKKKLHLFLDSFRVKLKKITHFNLFLFSILLLFFLFSIYLAVTNPFDWWDTLYRRALQGKIFFEQQRIISPPIALEDFNYNSVFESRTLLFPLLFTLSHMFFSQFIELPTRFIPIFFTLFTVIALYCLTEKLRKGFGLLACALFLTIPIVLSQTISGYVDIAPAFYLLLSFYFVNIAREKKELKYWALSGIFLGGMVWAREGTVILVGLLMLSLIIENILQKRKIELKNYAVVALLAFIVVGPFFIRSFVLSGMFAPPIDYPFFTPHQEIGVEQGVVAQVEYLRQDKLVGVFDFSRLLLFFFRVDSLGFVALLSLIGFYYFSKQQKENRFMAYFYVSSLIFWVAFLPFHSGGRYYLTILPLFCLIAVFNPFFERKKIQAILCILIAGSLIVSLFWITDGFSITYGNKTRIVDGDHGLRAVKTSTDVINNLNTNNKKIVTADTRFNAYFLNSVSWCSIANPHLSKLLISNEEQTLEYIKEKDIGFIVFAPWMESRYNMTLWALVRNESYFEKIFDYPVWSKENYPNEKIFWYDNLYIYQLIV